VGLGAALKLDDLSSDNTPRAAPSTLSRSERMKTSFLHLFFISFVVLLSACGVPEAEHQATLAKLDSVQHELATTRSKLEEIEFGPERLLAQASQAFQGGDDDGTIRFADQLLQRHPAAKERSEIQSLRSRAAKRVQEKAAAEKHAREAAEREKKALLARALSHMNRKHDEIRGITWYREKSSPAYVNSRSAVYLYLGKLDDGPVVSRFVVQYVADDWLFIQEIIIKADGETFTLTPEYDEVKQDNGSGEIWEWYDVVADDEKLRILRAIAGSKKTVIRYEGRQYRRDRVVGAQEKQSIRNALDALEVLQSGVGT
jgi:hypothetical protein